MKKVFASTVLGLSLTLASAIGANASTNENENVGVSTEIPVVSTDSESTNTDGGFTVFSIERPSTKNVKDLNDGQLSFSGIASGSTLYTNSHFKGKSTIKYHIKNSSSSKLTVKIISSASLFASKTLTVNPSSTADGTVKDLDKKKLYYISFSAPSNFSGYVK
ncbi:hypothetical protein [Priestia aryabhattai]